MHRDKLDDAFDFEGLVDGLKHSRQRPRVGELIGDARRHRFAEEDEGSAVGDREESEVVDVEWPRGVGVVDREDLFGPSLEDLGERSGELG